MAWTKRTTAAVGVAAVIILCGAITIWINSGSWGYRSPAELRIYNNGINAAHGLPDPLFSYPAGDETTRRYLLALFKRFRATLDPAVALKSDAELTDQDIRSRTIYIYGSPENHSFFRKVSSQLPILFESDGVIVGRRKFLGRDVGAIFVCPNPVNPNLRLVVYGAVSPGALKDMNGVFHGPTDYVVFNNVTRHYSGVEAWRRFLIEGVFDKSDPLHWRVDEKLQLLPPKALQRATSNIVAAAKSTTSAFAAEKAVRDNHADDERMIRNMEIQVSRAIGAKDLDRLVSLYADGAALYDESNPAIMGKDSIRNTWKTDFSRPGLTMSTEPQTVEISSSGDLAWAHGLYTIMLTDAAGRRTSDKWEYALIYMKQADGQWKIMADSANSSLHNHLFHKPPKSLSPLAAVAPLIGLGCFLFGVWFLFGMPVVVFIYSWKFCHSRKLSTGFLVSVFMLAAFFLTAVLLYENITAHYWNLPFRHAFVAAGDSARYGNPVEDTAESVLVTLLVLSTLSAIAAGAITGVARLIWLRHRAAPSETEHVLSSS